MNIFKPKLLVFTCLLQVLPSWSESVLSISGNDHLSRKQIEANLSLPDHPVEFTDEDWSSWTEDAISLLSELYSVEGYLDVAFQIHPQRDTTIKSGDQYNIQFLIREGERYKFGAIRILPTDSCKFILDSTALSTKTGKPYHKDALFRARQEVLHGYGNSGYLHARTTETIIPDTLSKVINVDFKVEAGPAVVFDTLIIHNVREEDSTQHPGNTKPKIFASLFNLKRGDTLSKAGMSFFEKKLKSTRVFNYVRLRDSLLVDRENRSAMVLSTEERVPGDLEASLFYETQYGAGISSDWRHGNIGGRLHEGRVGSSFAQRKQSVYLGYASPLFFGTSFRFDNDLISNWYQDSRFEPDASAFTGNFDITNSSKLSKTFLPWLRDVQSAELTGQSSLKDSTQRDRSFNINFINSVYLSFIDDVVNTTKGSRFSLSWGNGGAFINDGEILTESKLDAPLGKRHNWFEIESAFYYPLTDRFKLALRLDGGRFLGEGGINSERFFLGGPRSVRSFGWRQVCPEKDPLTGLCIKTGIVPAYFLGSFEIRTSPFTSSIINPEGHLRYLRGLQIVPFIDYGNVWSVGEKVTEFGRGRAYGLGLRYALLSIFNVRIDYAVSGADFSHSQWVLDLAQAF